MTMNYSVNGKSGYFPIAHDRESMNLRWPIKAWMAPLAAVAAIAMLGVFYGVVRGAVEQGALNRKVHAALVQANWRCNDANGIQAREDCKSRLIASTMGGNRVQALSAGSLLPMTEN